MCLLVAAYDVHSRYRLVLAGHRDEFHARPTAPLGWWEDSPGVLGGRDLQAGGTWLGVGRDGRLGAVTNFRGAGSPLPDAPSRGRLIPEFLATGDPSAGFARSLASRAAEFAGFNLLVYDGTGLAYVANRPAPEARPLAPGIYGLSNDRLDTPWPKVQRIRERITQVLEAPQATPTALFDALNDRQPAADEDLPDTGIGLELERLVSAPFIVDPVYGTRCTTLVLMDHDGGIRVEERRYAPNGETTGRTVMAFHTTRGAATGG
jgi:uncharacterized protein with NRDE domain